eukprot:2330853-Heterocapsa_arctica.AAC.1
MVRNAIPNMCCARCLYWHGLWQGLGRPGGVCGGTHSGGRRKEERETYHNYDLIHSVNSFSKYGQYVKH